MSLDENVAFNTDPMFESERQKDDLAFKYSYDDPDFAKYSIGLEDKLENKFLVTEEDFDFVGDAEDGATPLNVMNLNLFGEAAEDNYD